jgi:hypothetical protein
MNPLCRLALADQAFIVFQQWTRPASKSLSVAAKMPDQNVSGNHLEYSKQNLIKN